MAYELAKRQERFPEFMPDVESVVILSTSPSGARSRWKTIVEDAPIEWIEEDTFDDATRTIRFQLIEGDLEKFEGTWIFRDLANGRAYIELFVDYDFGVPTLAELIGPLLEQKVRENSQMMLAGLRREAEAARSV